MIIDIAVVVKCNVYEQKNNESRLSLVLIAEFFFINILALSFKNQGLHNYCLQIYAAIFFPYPKITEHRLFTKKKFVNISNRSNILYKMLKCSHIGQHRKFEDSNSGFSQKIISFFIEIKKAIIKKQKDIVLFNLPDNVNLALNVNYFM